MTISRREPMGLASRLPSATRSTSRSGRASSQAPPRRQVVKSIWVSSYIAREPGGVAGEAAVASHRPTARERAAISATASTSRPKRWENLTRSERGVPTPGRTSLPGSRTQKAMATARKAGSEAKRARRGAWSSSSTKVRNLGAARLARLAAIGADDLRDLRGDDVPVGVDGDEEGAPLQREARAAAGGRDAAGAAQAQGLALEIEQLLGVDLAAAALDVLQELALDGGHLLDLLAQALGVAELLPRGLEREGDGGVGRAAEVVGGDGAQRLEGGLREEGAEGARVLALPALELEEEGGREDELDPVLDLAPEDHAAGEQRLEPHRERGHLERAARLGDAVEQLAAGRREPRGVAHVGDAHQRARGLGGRVDALAGIDPDPHAAD